MMQPNEFMDVTILAAIAIAVFFAVFGLIEVGKLLAAETTVAADEPDAGTAYYAAESRLAFECYYELARQGLNPAEINAKLQRAREKLRNELEWELTGAKNTDQVYRDMQPRLREVFAEAGKESVFEKIYRESQKAEQFSDESAFGKEHRQNNKLRPKFAVGFDIERWIAENAVNPEQAAVFRAKLQKKFA